ncbi:MAG: Hpt domain-containing protein [Fidelibacterota bacterium]|nr:MAG: Hpt domain-containing protein [Candidatus Neomarinimicrobiota bacterium]
MAERQVLDNTVLERMRKLGGDKFLGELIDLFLEHVPNRLDEALAGEQAGDLEAIERAAHSIKSSAGNLGAMAILELTGQIEQLAADHQADAIPPLMRDLEAAFAQLRPRLEDVKRGAQG